jgi:hypothetical protein
VETLLSLLARLVAAAVALSLLVAGIFSTLASLVRVVACMHAIATGVHSLVGLEVDPGNGVVHHTTLRQANNRKAQQCRKRNEGEAPAKARVAVIDVHRGPPSPRARPREGLWR